MSSGFTVRKRIIPLTEEISTSPVMHPALTGNLGQGILWDLSRRPGTSEFVGVSEDMRRTLATTPPTRGPLSIHVEGLPYGPVTIMAEGAYATCITISDVVVAIYRAVQSEALRAQGLIHLQDYNRYLRAETTSLGARSDGNQQSPNERNEEEVTRVITRHFQGMTRWFGLDPMS